MATLRQIEANRRNAKASTGPRTDCGKAASRMNALKSGIDAQSSVIPGEDPEDLETLVLDYHHRFHPQTPEERFLVDTLIAADWQLRRLRRAEAQIWRHEIETSINVDQDNPIGHMAANRASTFSRLQRRLDSTDRTYHRALHTLRKIQSAPQSHPDTAPPPEIGFVPSPEPPTPSTPQPIGFIPLTSRQRSEPPSPATILRSRPSPMLSCNFTVEVRRSSVPRVAFPIALRIPGERGR